MQEKTFKPSESMTFMTVAADCQRLLTFCHANAGESLHLDLSQVTNCDSAGLALLIEAKRMAKELNKICKIDGMPKTIQALAEFCGVNLMLELG